MRERMRDIWDRVREKEALTAAGRVLCGRARRVLPLPPKLWISAACGLALTLAPIAGAANVF